MIEFGENNDPGARIKVIGAGGCGGNAINHMMASGLSNVAFISVNTDSQALQNNDAPTRIAIGQMLTRGRGTGGNRAGVERDRQPNAKELRGIGIVAGRHRQRGIPTSSQKRGKV
jgi:cell division protein FtsZ